MADKDDDHKNGEQQAQDGDLGDMLQEQRILLQGAQVLTAFLTILPFSQGFADVDDWERAVFLATFFCSISSLVLFTAPAAHHRMIRPLMNRELFKTFATRMIVIGLVPLSLALTLCGYLVVSQVIGPEAGILSSILLGLLIAIVWWVMALTHKERMQRPD